MPHNAVEPLPILRVRDAMRFLGLPKATFWRLRKSDATFPAPFRVCKRDFWYQRDLVCWLESRRRCDAIPGRSALAMTVTRMSREAA